jgi:hypothetical protein
MMAVIGSTLGIGFMYYEYSQPPIKFTRDEHGNVLVPADTKPEELFVNPAAGDFRLRAENPGIRAGTPVPEVTTDIYGKPRDPLRPSIGAVEFSGTPNTSGQSASKFFSAPFTYFVLFMTLLTNVMGLYLTSKLLKQSSQNQVALLGALKNRFSKKEKRDSQTLVEQMLKKDPQSKQVP